MRGLLSIASGGAAAPLLVSLTLPFCFIAAVPRGDAAPSAVMGLDLADLDEDGLRGPPDGLRAVDYEFCIPAAAAAREAVGRIDSSARFFPSGRGRIGCGEQEILVLGNTHQPGFRGVLLALASLPYVVRIEEAFFE